MDFDYSELLRPVEEGHQLLREEISIAKAHQPCYNTLSLTHKVYIKALILGRCADMRGYILPLRDNIFSMQVAPTLKMEDTILENLLNLKAIRLHENSSSFAIRKRSDGTKEVKMHLSLFVLNFSDISGKKGDAYYTVLSKEVDPLADPEEAATLWKQVACEELLGKIEEMLDEADDYALIREKIRPQFMQLLETESQQEINAHLQKSVRAVKRGNTTDDAASDEIARMLLSDGRKVGKPYSEVHFRSAIAEVLYNRVLKIGDKAYTEVPNIASLRHLWEAKA